MRVKQNYTVRLERNLKTEMSLYGRSGTLATRAIDSLKDWLKIEPECVSAFWNETIQLIEATKEI